MGDSEARDAEIHAFLTAHGWGAAQRRPLADDASFRRYDRLIQVSGDRAVLMDAPPPREDVRPFLSVGGRLRALGYSAPDVRAADAATGLLLLEDLGDRTFTRALAGGAAEGPLYELAVDLLIDLHQRFDPQGAPKLPPYDTHRLSAEWDLLVDWYLPAVGATPSEAARATHATLWREALAGLHEGDPTCVLRDYHVDNLMVLEARAGLAACGLLDFQDAVLGHRAYDLVSLLEDARRDVSEALAEAMIARYLAAFPGIDPEAFRAAYALCGAHRNAKIMGIFTRLWKRDGKPGYLRHLPRVWRLLERDLNHPALAPIRAWFAEHVPAGVVPSTENSVGP